MQLTRYLASTSRRNFVVLPAALLLVESLLARGWPDINPAGLILLPWGYLQYRLSGLYRRRHGGGGPGMALPPDRLVTTGIYAYTRNPMYLGHLIFIAGLAISLRSWIALAVLVAYVPWFQARVRRDEARLRDLFGAEYERYARRVKRWIPFII